VHGAFIDRGAETSATSREIAELRIRTPSGEQTVRNLSGGNQQKVVLAKWLIGAARVFLFDEPTRGIDVGAKAEIYALMVELLRQGAAIVMVSSELPEVLGMSHRVLVVRGGQVRADLARAEATPARVIAVATGVAA
jgi:ABC-type sugar transport system ATPase subunit